MKKKVSLLLPAALGMTSTSKAYSDFRLYDRVSDFPKEYTKKIPVMFGGDTNYEIKITAVDSCGKESESLVYNSVSDKPNVCKSRGISRALPSK
ncbi:MAG: hypothetical protein IJU94_02480 [Clostridia bacterium]|nr:hypothetical protein [Clostridia bacterium]